MAVPALVGIIAILSLDVTRGLVAQGLGLGYDTAAAGASSDGVGRFTATGSPAPLAITGATNATPIVVTTAYPHGVSSRGVGGLSCIVAGVEGNEAANNIDADPRSRTIGLNSGVLAVPLSATTLALYGQDTDVTSETYGALVPLVGNGTYSGGGTITPALTDGSILIGRENTREHSAPPRIVMVPRGVQEWGPRSNSVPLGARVHDLRRQQSQRSTATDHHIFDVHCWGARPGTPDAAYDYEYTLALAHQIENSAHLLLGVKHRPSGGSWDDQKERETQHIKAGHLFSFAITLPIPVLDHALPFAPQGTIITHEDYTGSGELGCSGSN